MNRCPRGVLQLSSSFAVVLLFLFAGAAAVASPGRCDNWTEVDTGRFRLITSLSEKKAVRIAEQLNRFEAAVEIVTDARDFEPAAPTTVYVLGYRDWSYLPQHAELTDFSSYDRFENRIFVLADLDHGRFPFATVMHEYVHYALANQGTLTYPRWYDEGLAEILSRSTEDRESFSIGILSRDGDRYYTWVPYETLFNTDLSNRARPGGVDVDTYNHEASLLVHYLMFGSPERKLQLARYLATLGRGMPQGVAFKESFHATYGDLEIESLKYLRRNLIDSYRIPKSALKPRANLVVRQFACARARADTGFAMLAEHADPVALSKDWFTGSDEDGAADWRLGRAATALVRKDFVMANQYINHAVAGRGVDGASLVRTAELLLAQVPELETGTSTLSPAERSFIDRASVLLATPEVQALPTPRAAYWRSVIACERAATCRVRSTRMWSRSNAFRRIHMSRKSPRGCVSARVIRRAPPAHGQSSRSTRLISRSVRRPENGSLKSMLPARMGGPTRFRIDANKNDKPPRARLRPRIQTLPCTHSGHHGRSRCRGG